MRVIFLAILALAASCKKEKDSEEENKTAEQLLTQKEWVLKAHGFDDNNNGLVDPSENVIQDCQKDNSYIFYPSGTGTASDNGMICNVPVNNDFEWRFVNDDAVLEIGSEKLFILRLDDADLILNPDIPGLAVKYLLSYTH